MNAENTDPSCHPERGGAQATASRRIPLPARSLPTKGFFDSRSSTAADSRSLRMTPWA